MKRSSKLMLSGLGIFLLAVMIAPPHSQSSGSAPVMVVNTPLPVSGTVSVGNTPSVSVANTPTVNLAGGSSISVGNPLDSQSNPAPLVTLEAAQPYEDQCGFVMLSGSSGLFHCNLQTIPSNKRLVIQEADFTANLDPGLKPVNLEMATNFGYIHFFTATFMGNDGTYDYFASHQETHLYVGKSQTPACYLQLSGTTVFPRDVAGCAISGFLVDAP